MIVGEQEEKEVEKINLTTTKTKQIMMSQKKENRDVSTTTNNRYSKQGIFEKYTNYGYTCNRTSTTDMMSINTNNTVDTNNETESDDSSN